MKWSFRIARIFGIDLKIHVSFFIIIVYGATMFGAFGPMGWAFGAGMMLLLFACVTLHEFGHSLVAQRFGVPVREIVLLPLGGVAMMGRNPDKPIQELFIAIAGPAVNVVIAALLLTVLGWQTMRHGLAVDELMAAARRGPSAQLTLLWLLQANIVLVIFNMIPAFPLDGGRVLRAFLGFFMEHVRATRIASTIGQIIAIVLGTYGLMSGNILLALVALFIFFGAGAENAEGQARTVLSTLRVGDAYNKHALVLSPYDRLSRVVDYILTSYQRDFAVLAGRELRGIVTREDVLQQLGASNEDVAVGQMMQSNIVHIDSDLSLDAARQKLAEGQARVGAVYDGDVYLGLISQEDIQEAYAILSFLQRQNGAMMRQEQAEPAPV